MTTLTHVNIYFIHSPTFTSVRKNNCMQFLQQLGNHEKAKNLRIVAKFIEVFEPHQISPQELKACTNLDKTGSELFDTVLKNLHVRNVSNALKHFQAFKEIAACTNEDAIHVVLEDDILYGSAVFENLVKIFEVLPKTADMVFLGLPMANNGSTNPFALFSEMYNIAPSCESYIISKAFATHLAANFLPIKFSTNVHLTYKLQGRPNVFVTKPNLFIDGSKFGAFPSTVETNNTLFMNPTYHKLAVIVKKESVSKVEEDEFESLMAQCNVPNHPDVLFLKAVLKKRLGHLEESKTIHETIYQALKEHHGVFSNESEFLKSYIDLFRLTQ